MIEEAPINFNTSTSSRTYSEATKQQKLALMSAIYKSEGAGKDFTPSILPALRYIVGFGSVKTE